jgi:hypothetical protein
VIVHDDLGGKGRRTIIPGSTLEAAIELFCLHRLESHGPEWISSVEVHSAKPLSMVKYMDQFEKDAN